jgi:hypothetical protein
VFQRVPKEETVSSFRSMLKAGGPYLVIALLTLAVGSGVAKATPASGSSDATTMPAQMLISDGVRFYVTKPESLDPTLVVPVGTVLTDARVSFSAPGAYPNAAALVIADRIRTFVYQLADDSTYEISVQLESGIPSDGTLAVSLVCFNIVNNSCQGAIMWSGYRP